MATLVDEEWPVLAALLPQDWRDLARTTGAIRRARGACSDPDSLLQVLFLHVAGGLSLRSAAARATELGLATMSDVALLKRLRTSEAWLRTLAARTFSQTRFGTKLDAMQIGRRFRAFDATTIEEPGATGTNWRVHFGISLPDLQCDFYELTDDKGGETFTRYPVSPGDVVLGDRGYSHRRGVAHVLKAKADVLVRLNSTSFPLLDEKGTVFDLLANLRTIKGVGPSEWPVYFVFEKKKYKVRLCAIRKTKVAAEKSKSKAEKTAKRKGKKIGARTLELAEYIFVLTSLPVGEADAAKVLDLYRVRWQIELVFKRMKSLMNLGHLPKYSDESSRAWIEGKLLSVMLIERLLGSAEFFSPWGFDIEATQSVARVHRSS
jgi:hypothetical protein